MCSAYKITTHVFSRLTVFFMSYPPEAGGAQVTAYQAQTAVPVTYLLPRTWDVGCGIEIALLLKRKGLWSLLAQLLLNICFIWTFPRCKPPLVMPAAYLVSAESSRSHQFNF